nr:N-6 DNA methylase [Candidatus Colwellbacteria bacterium]
MRKIAPQELKKTSIPFTFPEEPTAIIKELRNYLAGRTSGISRDEALLEEVLKVLFCLINFPQTKLPEEEFETAKEIRAEFSRLKSKLNGFYGSDEEILLDPKSIQYVAEGLRKILNNMKREIDIVANLYQAFIGGSIRGQEGQFFTPRVAVDFLVKAVGVKSSWKVIDTACGACSFLTRSYTQVLKKEGPEEAKNFAKKNLFGIEKDEKLSRLARIHLYVLTQELGNINNADSLLIKKGYLTNIRDGDFDLVITNPPFGARIKSADEETSSKYELGHKWENRDGKLVMTSRVVENTPPQVLFMERNVRALKPGGMLATVIPESLVSNENYKSVVNYLLRNTSIEAIIGMPESLFKTSGKGGTHTKTCLLIA